MESNLRTVTVTIGLVLLLATNPAGASDPCWGALAADELVEELAGGDPERRRTAARALSRSARCDPDFPAAVPEIMEAISDPDPEVREAAVCVVTGFGIALPHQRRLVSDRVPGVRGCALLALARTDPEGVSYALRALGDESEGVRMAARAALRDAAALPEALPQLTRALEDPRPEVRVAVVEAMSALGTRAPRDELVDLLSDPENAVRLQAAETLARTTNILPERVFRVLTESLVGGEEHERRGAAAVLQLLGTRAKPMLEPLIQAFEAAGESQADGLASALAGLAPVAPEARAALIAALDDSMRQEAALAALTCPGST